jgi:hypothetical protein
MHRRRILAQHDADGNGRLDRTEIAALREDISERVDAPIGSRFGRLVRMVRHYSSAA